jgi:3-oxoacyl-[acyl-carrier-protein] synthase-1
LNTVPLNSKEKKRTGLFLASSSLGIDASEQEYKMALRSFPETAIPIPQIDYNGIGDALRNKFNLGPHTYTSITACTSTANALLFAERMLQMGSKLQTGCETLTNAINSWVN